MDAALSEFDKIQILLHEYDSLRSEIIQRWVGAQQQISIGVVVIVGLLTVLYSNKIERPRSHHFLFVAILVTAVCVFALAMWQFSRDTEKAAARVREIEREVNKRAGEELLQWENRWGGAVRGYWGKAEPLPHVGLKPK